MPVRPETESGGIAVGRVNPTVQHLKPWARPSETEKRESRVSNGNPLRQFIAWLRTATTKLFLKGLCLLLDKLTTEIKGIRFLYHITSLNGKRDFYVITLLLKTALFNFLKTDFVIFPLTKLFIIIIMEHPVLFCLWNSDFDLLF